MPELKPCPNPKCTGTHVSLGSMRNFYDNETKFYGQCDVCNMEGPYKDIEEDAIDAWNAIPRREDAARLVEALEDIARGVYEGQPEDDLLFCCAWCGAAERIGEYHPPTCPTQKARTALAEWRHTA